MAKPKTLITVSEDRHQRISNFSKATETPIKTIADAVIDFALPKLEAGELALSEPTISETRGRPVSHTSAAEEKEGGE